MESNPPGSLPQRIAQLISPLSPDEAGPALSLLEGVYEQSSLGFVEYNRQGEIISANRLFSQMTGISPAQAVGSQILDVTEKPEFRAHISQLLAHGESTPVTCVISDTGTPCTISSWSVETQAGPYFHSTFHELTPSFSADSAVEITRGSFTRVIEHTDSLVFFYQHHPEKRFSFINRRCEDITGYSADEFYHNPDLGRSIIHPEDLSLFQGIFKNPKENQILKRVRIIRKDGRIIWTSFLLIPVCNEQGQVIAVDGIVRDISAYLAEEERFLRASEDYRRIFNGTQAAMFLIEIDQQGAFRYLRTNRAHQEKTGISLEDIAGKTPGELLGTKLAKQVCMNYRRCLESREVVTYEEQLSLPKGTRVWLTELTPIYENSQPVMIIGSSTDITALKKYEQARKKTEEWIRSILQGAPVGIGVVQEGIIREANEQTSAIIGIPRRKLLGMEFDSLFSHITIEPGETKEFSWTAPGKDSIDIIMTTSPIISQGAPRGFIFSLLDISERKQAELEVKRSEERFRTLYENATLGMYQTTPSGKVLMANAALLEMLGYDSLEELQQRDLNSEGYGNETQRKDFLDRFAETDNINGYEAVWKKRDGSTIYVRESARAVRNAQREIQYFEGTVENITSQRIAESEKEQLQQQLFQTQKMESVGRLAGGVAHDFNNMLGVIVGYSEMALDLAGEGSTIREYLQEILQAAKRSGELTRQLLTFARKQQVSPTVHDINKVISSMMNMLDLLLGEQIDLIFVPDEYTWPVAVDASQMHQVMTNLLANARDAIDQTGRVTIATSNIEITSHHSAVPSGQYVLITVEDTGRGMTQEVLDRLFEPYFTTKELGKGTGLGLSSVLGIIQQSKGYIEAASSSDRRTTFSIYLPRSRSEETVQESPKDNPDIQGAETILFVEDEASILELGSKMLSSKGYQVLTAQHPKDALEAAKTHRNEIDLLITDVVMPDLNGKELQQHLLEIIPGLKTLFISGYSANLVTLEDTQQDSQSDFLPKPFSIGDLVGKVSQLLSS